MKTATKLLLIPALALGLSACNDAEVVNQNLKTDADNFRIVRRITVINGVTDNYLLTVEGYCSQEQEARKLAITCKTPTGYKRHLIVLSDNVTAVSEQLEPNKVSASFYRTTWKPSVIIPDIEIR